MSHINRLTALRLESVMETLYLLMPELLSHIFTEDIILSFRLKIIHEMHFHTGGLYLE